MLVNFKFENHLSFKNESVFSMISVPSFKEHLETNTIKVSEDLSLLSSACVFGANASGKSNFVKSFLVMSNFVQDSFVNALSEEGGDIKVNRFLLNTETETKPASFEVIFFIDEILYRYGFSITQDEVVEEHLYRTLERETILFSRRNKNIKVNKSSFKEGVGLEKKTREDVLFLSLVAQLNGPISRGVKNWFESLNCISGLDDSGYRKYTTKKLKTDKEFKSWVDKFISFLEIEQVTTQEVEINIKSNGENDAKLTSLFRDVLIKQQGNEKIDEIITWHRKYDENNFLVDTIPFFMRQQESEGTQKLIYLLGPIYDTIINGRILVVDEFDSRLHTLLSEMLINFFKHNNDKNAQIVYVLHDTNLLDKDLFRRDQIWFTEKDQFGSSDLYSLSDYKSSRVRKDDKFEKHYLEGRYGGIPMFEEFAKIN